MNKKIKLSHFINRLGCGDEILYCSRVYIHARLYGGAWIWMEWCINFVFYFIRGHKNHVRRAYLWERRYHAKAKIQNIEDSTSEKKTPPVGNETPPDANETLIEEGVPEMKDSHNEGLTIIEMIVWVLGLGFIALVCMFSPVKADDAMIDQMLRPSAIVQAGQGFGSATAVKSDSIMGTYLVTNWHVVQGNFDNLSVKFYSEEVSYKAYVHSVDVQNDIAVILINHKHDFVAMVGKPVSVFDEIFCVGSPLGSPTAATKGMVSGVDVNLFGSLHMTRIDCGITNGSSGGGVFALQDGVWKYVGIPSQVFSQSTGLGRANVYFMGLAVRIEDVLAHLSKNNIIKYSNPTVMNTP